MYVYIYRDTYIRIYPYRIFKCTVPLKSGAVWQRIYETMIPQERIHTEAHWGALTVYVWKNQCLIKVLALGAGISPLNFRFKVALVNCWHAFRRCRLVQSVRPRSGLILQRSLSPVKFRAQSPLWNHDMRFVCVCGWCVCVRVCVCILYSDSAGSHKLRAWVLGRGTFPVHFHTMLISWQVQCAFRLRRPTQNKQRGLGLGPRPQHPPLHLIILSIITRHHINHNIITIIIIIIIILNIIIFLLLASRPSFSTSSSSTSSTSSSSSSSSSSTSSTVSYFIPPLSQHRFGSRAGIMVIVQPGRVYDCHMASNHHGVLWLPYGIKSSWCLLDIFICVLISLISSITYSFMHAFINFQTVYLFIHYRVCSEDWINKHIYICFR